MPGFLALPSWKQLIQNRQGERSMMRGLGPWSYAVEPRLVDGAKGTVTLQELQASLDRSLERATPFARSLFAASPWGAEDVQSFANSIGGITLATVDSHGRPHAAPVIASFLDGTLYCSVSNRSALLRHLLHDEHVAFTITGNGHTVMGAGSAHRVGTATALRDLGAALGPGSKLGALFAEPWDGFIYTLAITRIFAN